MKNVIRTVAAMGMAATMMQAQAVPGFSNQPSAANLGAQEAPAPAAAADPGAPAPPTAAEIEELKKIQAATDADSRMKAVDAFAIRFPKSVLLSTALTMGGEAAQTKNDFAKTNYYYEKAIAADATADYARIMLAANIAQNTQEGAMNFASEMAKAQKLVTEGMELVSKRQMGQGQSKEEFENLQKDDLASGHMTLGLIHLANKRAAEAGKEFLLSVDSAKNPNVANLLRAGMAFNGAGQPDEAVKALDRFLAIPGLPQQYKDMAQQQKDIAKSLKK